jgi:hypothetical protein
MHNQDTILTIDESRWKPIKIWLDDNDIEYTHNYDETVPGHIIKIKVYDMEKAIRIIKKQGVFVSYDKSVLSEYIHNKDYYEDIRKKEMAQAELEKAKTQLNTYIAKMQHLKRIKEIAEAKYKEDRIFSNLTEAEKPIKEWAKEQLKQAFIKNDRTIYSTSDLKYYAIKGDNGDTLIHEDNNVIINGWIDYDFGYSMLVYKVKCKHTNLIISDAEMIAKD